MKENFSAVSLGKRLRLHRGLRCLGVKPNWDDYSQEERRAIRKADRIFYPSPIYENLFHSLGKGVFPGAYYGFMGNKIRQTSLFQLLGISHPRTRLYYGRGPMGRILSDYRYPFVAKTPVGSSKGVGVWLIETESQLSSYLENHNPAYIQEYLPIERDLRVVLAAGKVVHAYWRIPQSGEFRNNVFQGASISCEGIPLEALEFAVEVVERCGFGEVGLDICEVEGRYYVLEANMVFGLEGFRQVGLNIHELLAQLDV